MINGFQAKKLNTSGELELAANRTEPQNQAVHHVKGRPTASTYFQEKGGVNFDTNHAPPCSFPTNFK